MADQTSSGSTSSSSAISGGSTTGVKVPGYAIALVILLGVLLVDRMLMPPGKPQKGA